MPPLGLKLETSGSDTMLGSMHQPGKSKSFKQLERDEQFTNTSQHSHVQPEQDANVEI